MTHLFPSQTVREFCASTATELMNVESQSLTWVSLWTFDPVQRHLVHIACSPENSQNVRHRVIESDKVLGGLAIEARLARWFPDVSKTIEGRSFSEPHLIKNLSLKGMYSIPILNSFNRHQVLGLANLFTKQNANCTETDTQPPNDLLSRWRQSIDNFGIGFERCLEQESACAVNRLHAVIGKASASAQRRNLKGTCRLFAHAIREMYKSDLIIVYTRSSISDALEMQAWAGDVQPFLKTFQVIDIFANEVSHSNREELDLFVHSKQVGWSLPLSVRQTMGIPLRNAEGLSCGAVVAINHQIPDGFSEPDPFTYEQVAVIEAMGQAFVPRIEILYAGQSRLDKMSRLAHEMRVPVSAFGSLIEGIQKEMLKKGWKFKHDYVGALNNYLDILQWNVRDLDLLRGAEFRIRTSVAEPCLLQGNVIDPARIHLDAECKRRRLDSSRIKIRVPFSEVIPELYIDKTLMTQVVFNLLENAIKYSQSSPESFSVEITPSTLPNGDYEISFVDNGRGVPTGFEEKIFAAGYRHPASFDVPGDGWGLFVSRRLIELHGGKLYARPRKVGAEFVIQLPQRLKNHPPDAVPQD